MSTTNVVNPGLVNVADQGDGLISVDQPVKVGPSTNPGPVVAGLDSAPGLGTDSPDQPVTVSPPQTANTSVAGGTYSPTSPNTENVITNNVVEQVYGTGSPTNVFV